MQRVAADACGAHEDIEARQPVDGRVQLRRVAHVVAVLEVEDVHVGAALAQQRDGRRADPARAAGDQRDASFEVVVVAHGAFLYGFLRELRPAARLPAGVRAPRSRHDSRRPVARRAHACTAPTSSATELRATPETLRLQADVAAAAGRSQLADNLRRAAELAPLPDETILEIYTALRPRRSSADELEAWAVRLEELDAPLTAAFVRDALRVYGARGLLAA